MIDIISQINLSKLLEASYIFEKTPAAKGLYLYLAIVFGLLLVLALILIIQLKKKEKIYKKLHTKIINLLLFTGFLGLVLIFFRWQQIPYLGSRFFMLVLAGVVIIWLGVIYWYRFLILPKEIEKYEKQKIFEKYLP